MANNFLYNELDTLSKWGGISRELPPGITQNLHPKYELREYQVEAFARFVHCYTKDYPGKSRPLHLLFNMATGSGKTLIMAGLIVYLYEQGYRNFLFFVNSTNIIEKTKDNFLNPASNKYLFNSPIHLNDRPAMIIPVENFEGVNPQALNICFTTIQKLHSDLTTQKENALTFDDFRKHKIVLIADEAHHINVRTRAQTEMFESWENTVEKIFRQNEDNLLLEFTATHDYATQAMIDKYLNKVIIRYDLIQFRENRYSKDIVIVQSDFNQSDRILQALIISQYKQEVAAKYRIYLKPVILFKAQRTIAQSVENKAAFHDLIDNLAAADLERIRKSDIPLVQRAFRFFAGNNISDDQLVKRLKFEFQKDFCLSVNEESEKEHYQLLLNSLEERTNRIRAIFAVQKLSEGWDVLNLFDIVRCYESRDAKGGKPGGATVAEAQLIGRGARYYPFIVDNDQVKNLIKNNDRFRRKFGDNIDHELRVLEELHYHSINDSRYISEIRTALIEQGILDKHEVTRDLKLKEAFKTTELYKQGIIWLNKRQPTDFRTKDIFTNLSVRGHNYTHAIATGHGGVTTVLEEGAQAVILKDDAPVKLKISEIDRNIILTAIARLPFYHFNRLKKIAPDLSSIIEFITDQKYLGGLAITFRGNVLNLKENRRELLNAVLGLLKAIEAEISAKIQNYEGTTKFHDRPICTIFTDKQLKFDSSTKRGKEDPEFDSLVSDKDWFAFNTICGTDEEKDFVRALNIQMQRIKIQYDQVYLLRNEGHFAIYNFTDGQPFQPDFVLFLRQKNGEFLTYQMFIEPKAQFLQKSEPWKLEFLKNIRTKFENKIITLEGQGYRLIGAPFYDNANENKFLEDFNAALNILDQ